MKLGLGITAIYLSKMTGRFALVRAGGTLVTETAAAHSLQTFSRSVGAGIRTIFAFLSTYFLEKCIIAHKKNLHSLRTGPLRPLTDILAKTSQNSFSYSFVSEYSKHLIFFLKINFHFLAALFFLYFFIFRAVGQ